MPKGEREREKDKRVLYIHHSFAVMLLKLLHVSKKALMMMIVHYNPLCLMCSAGPARR